MREDEGGMRRAGISAGTGRPPFIIEGIGLREGKKIGEGGALTRSEDTKRGNEAPGSRSAA